MITLHQFPRATFLPSFSPFCLKLETYLRMTKLPHESKYSVDRSQFSKQKFPVIEDNGKIVEDSTFAIDYLKEKYGDPLDEGLTVEMKAVALAFQRMVEDNLVPCALYFRWVDPVGWPKFRDRLFRGVPSFIKYFFGMKMTSYMKKRLWMSGQGRHSKSELLRIIRKDLKAIQDYLGNKDYFFGDKPSTIDCSIFGVIANFMYDDHTAETQALREEFPILRKYSERILREYYPELKY